MLLEPLTAEITRMKRLTFVVMLVSLVAGNALAQDVNHGKQVYTDTKCAVCHSIGSQGNKKGPLDDVGSKVSTADIRECIVSAPEKDAKRKANGNTR